VRARARAPPRRPRADALRASHTSHHLLALYALGSSPALIRAAYAENAAEQRERKDPPGPIDSHTFRAHLEDDAYYGAYLAFFGDVVKREGVRTVLEEYIFKREANVDPEAEKKGEAQPWMLVRFLAGVVHPVRAMGVCAHPR
jgi:hypothetical protein